ncbi:hypothetical protein DID88_006180 [Monilinia fructigena]|uniref:Phytocyanin domain-containing protein n=1 Tax=Monilinia fructigena TaxID=38457 RepID=A0A395J1Y8_9HELO|nr:hypothetical protein DID88_006180 [Monilinia fructigena]
MHSSKATLLLGAFPLALAAYGAADTSPSSAVKPSTTSSTSPSDPTHTILVGAGGQLTFSPNETKADVNTTLEFHFYPQTHSVAQAAFASPLFSVLVNDTKPIWFYCGFARHCENGMVGAVNIPTENPKTLAQFAAAAKKLNGDATKNPPGLVGGTFAPVKAESSGTGTSTTSESGSSSSATGSSTAASASSSGGAGIVEVGWITFAGAVGVAGLLGM